MFLTDLYFVDRFAETLFQLKVSWNFARRCIVSLHVGERQGCNIIAISYKVHDQTVGKVLKKVREGGEGTTSKSEKGRYKNIAFCVQKLYANF